MVQKTTWMHYLIIGISLNLILVLSSCTKDDVEYKLDADIIYKNESSHTIKYYQYDPINSQKVFVFELIPNAEKKLEIRGSGGNKNDTVDNCCLGILEGFQGNSSILIAYDNETKCLIYSNGEGPTTSNISIYESREISDRYYEFIYRFTDAEYNLAENCN